MLNDSFEKYSVLMTENDPFETIYHLFLGGSRALDGPMVPDEGRVCVKEAPMRVGMVK